MAAIIALSASHRYPAKLTRIVGRKPYFSLYGKWSPEGDYSLHYYAMCGVLSPEESHTFDADVALLGAVDVGISRKLLVNG